MSFIRKLFLTVKRNNDCVKYFYIFGLFKIKKAPYYKKYYFLGIQLYKKKKKFTEQEQIYEYFFKTSPKDLFLHYLNSSDSSMQLIITYLAIEEYYKKNKIGYSLYNKIPSSDGFINLDNVISLIKAFEQNNNYECDDILINDELSLCSGGEILVVSYYFNSQYVKVKNDIRLPNVSYGVGWLVENNYSEEEISIIYGKLNELRNSINNRVDVSCILWAPVYPIKNLLLDKLKIFCKNISNCKEFSFTELSHERIIEAVYFCDEIDNNLIREYKIKKMQPYFPKILTNMILTIDKPIFEIKPNHIIITLKQAREIKRGIRGYCKKIMPDYFFDFTIHTSDNSLQTKYIQHLFYPTFSILEYLEKIKTFNYMIIKLISPNMQKNFPFNLSFSSDIDIIVSKQDFKKLVDFTYNYAVDRYSIDYEINIVDLGEHEQKITLNLHGYLIFMFHIYDEIKDVSDKFIENSLLRKEWNKYFWIPSKKDEICYRFAEYHNYQSKISHWTYILENSNDIDFELISNNVNNSEELLSKLKLHLES